MTRAAIIIVSLMLLMIAPGYLLPTQDIYEPVRSAGDWGEVRLTAQVSDSRLGESEMFLHSSALTIEGDPSFYECMLSPEHSELIRRNGASPEIKKSTVQRFNPPRQATFYSRFNAATPEEFRIFFVFDFEPCGLDEKLEVARTFEPKKRRMFLWSIIYDAMMSV